MNSKLLLLAISVAALGSCTTMYKAGQTPDDVYFSPVRLTGGEEKQKEEPREEVKNYNYEDRMIRWGIYDRRYRNFYYDYDYAYTPYKYGFNTGYYYNPYYWPYPVYSSAYTGVYYTTPVNPKNTTPRMANLGAYTKPIITSYGSTNTKTGTGKPTRSYNNTNNGSAVGNAIRQIFTPSNSGNSDSYNPSSNSSNSSSNNTRTYSPSSSSSSGSSSSGSGSSGSGGGVSRPARGGGN